MQQRFWWPAMTHDIREFVSACPICAQNKSSNRPPVGLLNPLPIFRQPWSHGSLDFVTGLPPSRGNTVVLRNEVDRFGKAVDYCMSRLPSAKETAEAYFGERCPSPWISYLRGFRSWTSIHIKILETLVGASVSLSSGYHPQSNGQTE